MIAHLRGSLLSKSPDSVIIEVGGVGYRVAMSTASIAALPALGGNVAVWTHMQVREDGLSLFGFSTEEERTCFESLITVAGVGPKVALAALSTMSPAALASAVDAEDVTLVCTIPGVGKKVAQRLILELKGKLVGANLADDGSARDLYVSDGVKDALLSMGFTPIEIRAAVKEYEGDPADTSAAVRHALRRLGADS